MFRVLCKRVCLSVGYGGSHFGCAVSIEAGIEVCLKVVRDVHLSVKEGNTEPLESETAVNGKWISFCWRTLRAKLVRAEGGTAPARGAQWVGKKCG